MTIQQQLSQQSVGDDRTALGRDEAHLRSACRTLVATSSDVVDAMTLSIRSEEFGVSSDDWSDIALVVAKEHALHVVISRRHDHMTIRFTREASREHDGS